MSNPHPKTLDILDYCATPRRPHEVGKLINEPAHAARGWLDTLVASGHITKRRGKISGSWAVFYEATGKPYTPPETPAERNARLGRRIALVNRVAPMTSQSESMRMCVTLPAEPWEASA
jgi:hypothetical protein